MSKAPRSAVEADTGRQRGGIVWHHRPVDTHPGPERHGRSLWPKEHGAYGQLALPMLGAFASGTPALAALLIALAAFVFFVAHEPLLVLLGQRGARAKETDGDRARRRLIVEGVLGSVVGAVGLALAPPGAQLSLLLPIALGGALIPVVARKEERTLQGEILVAAALAAPSVPIAISSGVAVEPAFISWGVWTLAFAASVVAVRATIAHHKDRGTGSRPGRSALALAAITAGAAALYFVRGSLALATIPMLVFSWALLLAAPAPRHLKKVGWALVGASAAVAATLVAVTRAFATP